MTRCGRPRKRLAAAAVPLLLWGWMLAAGVAAAPSSLTVRAVLTPTIIAAGAAHFLPVAVNPLPPTATPTATPPSEPPWLARFNQFRLQSGLTELVEIEAWSGGDWLHGRYMVKNDYVGHSENPANPWYTPEGLAAAQNGNVFVSSWVGTADETVLDFWMSAPFHAVSMLDPQLAATGFGSYHEAIGQWKTGATLDVARGRVPLPPGTSFPIAYPAAGAETWLWRYPGGEFPDPLASCPGYSPPSGPPIILQIGGGELTPLVTGFSLERNGAAIAACLFDETSYVNPNPAMQNSGRLILNSRDAIVVMPREPFASGDTIAVSITANGATTSWSFTVGSAGQAALQDPAARVEMR